MGLSCTDKFAEMGFWKALRKHPVRVIVLMLASFVILQYLIWPGEDTIPVKRPELHEVNTNHNSPISAQTAKAAGRGPQMNPTQLAWHAQLKETTCGVEGACAKSAARMFREGEIRRSDGTSSARLFAQPKTSERIVVKKFERLIHHRFHESAFADVIRRTTETPCTADTFSCAQQWYQRSVNNNCIATGPVYRGGEQRCTEPYRLNLTPPQTRDNVRVEACVDGAVLLLSRGAAGQTLAAFPGTAEDCWRLADQETP